MSDQVVDAASIGGRHRLHLRELVLVHTGLGLDACRGQPVAERFVPAFGGFQRDMALEEQIAELLDLFRLVLFGKRQRLGEQPARSGLVGLEQLIGRPGRRRALARTVSSSRAASSCCTCSASIGRRVRAMAAASLRLSSRICSTFSRCFLMFSSLSSISISSW